MVRRARVRLRADGLERVGYVGHRRTVARCEIARAVLVMRLLPRGAKPSSPQDLRRATTSLFVLDRAGRLLMRLNGSDVMPGLWATVDLTRLADERALPADRPDAPLDKAEFETLCPGLLSCPSDIPAASPSCAWPPCSR
jgi:hypothetical protein